VTYVIPDAVSPTTPATLTATANKSKKQILISWDASTDNVGVAGYRVWRNGAEVGTSTTTSWIDQTWKAGASYTYSVEAYDAGGNVSARSNSVTVNLAGGRR
jgi:chitodextrinase